MKKCFLFIGLIIVFLFPQSAQAIYDPLSVPNNLYGIHIADFNDLPDVAALVNSSGGDWGYVTVVASDHDRDTGKWQELFNHMRRLHLIPLVRLATHVSGDTWVKPDKDKFKEISSFFNKLNWPIANRYVIIYNEPNHAKEWGGTLNPEDYAEVLVSLTKELKQASNDFFVLPAGLDVSAESNATSLDAAVFWQRMVSAQPEILSLIDGWTSHSYPNPGFSGSPLVWGRGTLRSFDWELGYLQQLGLTRALPVFITETGWIHSGGKIVSPKLLSATQVGRNVQAAAQSVWNDPRIVAVTPFVLNYQDEPFDHFSWKKFRDTNFYPHYYDYQALFKVKGQPQQHEVFTFSPALLPTALVAGSTYNLTSGIANTGQSILDQLDGYELIIEDPRGALQKVFTDPLPVVEPGEMGKVNIHLKTNKNPGIYPMVMKLKHGSRQIELLKENIVLVPPPRLHLTVQLGWRKTSDGSEVTVLVYDTKNTLLEKFTGLKLQNGTLDVSGLVDVVPEEKYRVVILVPYYLPQQATEVIGKATTIIKLKRLLPFDFDHDGSLTLHDLVVLLQTQPNTVLGRFVSP